MSNYDEEFINTFNEHYPFERYIVKEPKKINYLFDDVDVVSTFRCLNLNSYALEQTIHNFFADVRLDIKLYDYDENVYVPKEWFCVPLDVIEETIGLIVAGKISDYVFDAKADCLLLKNVK